MNNIDDFEKRLHEFPADETLAFSVLMNTLIHNKALMNTILALQMQILDKLHGFEHTAEIDKLMRQTIDDNIAKYQAEMTSKLYPKD